MEVCKDVMDGLSLLTDDSRVSENDLKKILTHTSQSLISMPITDSSKSALNKCEFKLLSLSLATVFIQASRLNKGLSEEIGLIQSVLSEAGLDVKYHSLVTNEYSNIASKLKNLLINMKINGCQDDTMLTLVDVSWRQDLIIKSKLRPQISQVNYLIKLKGKEDDSEFSIDCQGLQQLCFKLKDSCKIFENTFKQCS
jgi:hypothetical protein